MPENTDADDVALCDSTVLVVDDNPQNLELLVAYLDTLECQVVTACDGLQAMETVQAQIPDLILLDVMMPRMSGFEVCRKLKSDPRTREIPIIMVTAERAVGYRTRVRRYDDFISKPVNRLELLTRVKSAEGSPFVRLDRRWLISTMSRHAPKTRPPRMTAAVKRGLPNLPYPKACISHGYPSYTMGCPQQRLHGH